jgi:hypothetical protein
MKIAIFVYVILHNQHMVLTVFIGDVRRFTASSNFIELEFEIYIISESRESQNLAN